MRRSLVIVFLLMFTACGKEMPSAPPRHDPPSVTYVPADDPWLVALQSSSIAKSLSTLIGWVEWERTARADYRGGAHAILVPLEAEDEHRTLCAWFDRNQLRGAVVLGYAETSWFSTSRAETLSTYEGWVFLYDNVSGERVVASYFPVEGETDARSFTVDPNADRCLAETATSAPEAIRPSIFLARERLSVLRAVATELPRFAPCW